MTKMKTFKERGEEKKKKETEELTEAYYYWVNIAQQRHIDKTTIIWEQTCIPSNFQK